MSHIEIEAGGRRVVVDHDAELAHVAAEAKRLWDHTAGAPDQPGPAYGFSAEARWTPEVSATNNSAWRRPFAPVKAEAGKDGGGQ